MLTKTRAFTAILTTATALAAIGASAGAADNPVTTQAGGSQFSHPTRINNPYLPISQSHRCKLAGLDQGTKLKVTRTLLKRTKAFQLDGKRVEAAIVRDRVIGDGSLIEIAHDYFAQDDAGAVFYFGEDVSDYKDGHLVSHEGQWLLGRDTKHPGLLMPAHPKVGDSFRSERVPGVTHEVDTVVAKSDRTTIHGHTYSNVITVRENATPPPETEFKKYSRGTGVIAEANGGVHLVGCN